MSEIRTLREEMARIATNAYALMDEVTDETTEERSNEIDRQFDAMMADHDKKQARAERLEKAEEARRIAEEAPDQRRPKGENIDARSVLEEANDGNADAVEELRTTYTIGNDKLFDIAIRTGGAGLTAEQRSILEMRAQSVGTTTEGGFLAPEGFSGEIDRAMAAWGPMWQPGITRELNTPSGNKIPWPTVDDTANTGRIKAENASVDDDGTDDVVFGEAELDAYVYDTGMIRVPMELMSDSFFDIEALLNDLLGERMGRLANNVLTLGTGTAQPQGIVVGSALGKTAATNAAITSDELIDLLHSVDPAYRSSPMTRWQFNDSTLAAIRKLKDGQNNYLWQMGDVRVGEPATLLGHPYSINQDMASIATVAKTVLFGDHSRFVVRKVIGFQMLTLRERYAENFQVGVVGFKRFDSVLLRTSAVKHLVHPV